MKQQEYFTPMKNDQPVLILIHYFGGSAESWNFLLEYLQKDFECLSIRLPGFGGEKPMPSPSIEKYSEFVQNEISSRGISRCVLIRSEERRVGKECWYRWWRSRYGETRDARVCEVE